MREDGAAPQDSGVLAGHDSQCRGEGESVETVAADAQRIPCFGDGQALAPGCECHVEVRVEGHALAGLRPTQARGTREREGDRLVQGCEWHQGIQFRKYIFVELAGVAQVAALYDSVATTSGPGAGIDNISSRVASRSCASAPTAISARERSTTRGCAPGPSACNR